ncbi:3307_t:CDS:2, partial [Cetraspora pellucida]
PFYNALFDIEKEIQPDFNRQSSTGIKQIDDDMFAFDWHSYERVKEIIKSDEEMDYKLIESDESFESNDNKMKIIEEEYDMPLPFE